MSSASQLPYSPSLRLSAGQIPFLMSPFSLKSLCFSAYLFLALFLGCTVRGFGLNSRHHRLGRQIDPQVAVNISPELKQEIFPTSGPFFASDNAYTSVDRASNAETGIVEPFFLHPDAKSHHSVSTLSAEGNPCGNGPLVMGYYPDWAGNSFPPEKIDFKRYNWIDFAFAVPSADFSLEWDDKRAPDLLKKLVELAHDQGAKVKLSIGGWTGSKYFSDAVFSEHNRAVFVESILATYNAFGLDGIDIDWEYPGRKGARGNHFHPSDSSNFLSFLQLLRVTLPPGARISAAVETTPFLGTDGEPMTDVSNFAGVLDWVLIMNYDLWGSSSNPGPNAPLHDACGNSTEPDGSAVAAYNAWTKANFPACQLVLGLPSYGYVSKSKVDRLRTRAKSKKPKKDSNAIVTEDGGDDSQVQFLELVKQGALIPQDASAENKSAVYWRIFEASHGFERRWDACSDTPFLRSLESEQVVTYDDPYSLALKAAFAKEVGMLGINMFDIHGDTEDWDLIDSVRRSLGV